MSFIDQLHTRFENWVVSRHKPENGPIQIRRGRCYILPTRPGYVFAFMLLAMLMGAMNYSNNLVFTLTFLLGGIGLVCMNHTNSNLLGLSISTGRIKAVFAGEDIWIPVHIRNTSERDRYSILSGLKRRNLSADLAADCVAGGDGSTGFSLSTEKRGVYRVPRFAVATEFPLGLFQAWSWLSLTSEYVVYPKPSEGSRPIPPRPDAAGTRQGYKRGREEFAGLRDYQAGDSMHSVHWKSYSHSDQLSVKQFTDPLDETLWLDWEQLQDVPHTEQRLSQMCRWILDCDATGLDYGLQLLDVQISPSSGRAHKARCLEALARFS